jgi:TrmH family RNA methyltransferase
LERAETGQFAAEGEDLAEEALLAGVAPVMALLDAEARDEELGDRLRSAGADVHLVAPDALAAVSSLRHPARCVVVVERAALPGLEPGSPAAAVGLRLHGLADPGNVGALIRSAGALGPAHVALGPRCADPLSPRALRASMGAVFRVPLTTLDARVPGRHIALVAGAPAELRDTDLTPPVAFELGSERAGLPEDVLEAADAVAGIPQAPGAESLNVAAAGAIALYELRRRT